MTSTFLTSPLDVVKTRLQSDFYKNQLAAKRSAQGQHTTGIVRQGLQHFSETFQILGYVEAPIPPHLCRGGGEGGRGDMLTPMVCKGMCTE
jgi:hypothetical protein